MCSFVEKMIRKDIKTYYFVTRAKSKESRDTIIIIIRRMRAW